MEFIGREEECARLKKALEDETTKAVLVYGRRRVGKTTLIREVLKNFEGNRLIYKGKVQPTERTVRELSAKVTEVLGMGAIELPSLDMLFSMIGANGKPFYLVIDEYQDLKKLENEMMDALLRNAMDDMPGNLKIVLSGSSIRMMEALNNSDNPLYERFKDMILVDEMDYYDSQKFYPSFSTRDKIILYSVFGGIPWINESIDESLSVKENIINLFLQQKGLARTYAEDVISIECAPILYANEVFTAIRNGKRRYTDIESFLSLEAARNQLPKTLKQMRESRLIAKRQPINSSSRKNTFYEILPNVLRFYFAYQNALSDENISNLETLYRIEVEPSLVTYVSYRYEGIARAWFARLSKSGRRSEILRIGTYCYDDRQKKRNGEFDVALELDDKSYEIYEVKFLTGKADRKLILEEAEKVRLAPLSGVRRFGFISSSGFEEDAKSLTDVILASGEELYKG